MTLMARITATSPLTVQVNGDTAETEPIAILDHIDTTSWAIDDLVLVDLVEGQLVVTGRTAVL